jgi:glycosyltransferase involved in cell wall biosynthesis
MSYSEKLKIAIVHDWFDKYAGSERVVEQILHVFPQADLFSLVDFLKPNERSFLQGKTATTTFIQNLPFARKNFRRYLPFFPLAIEQLDLSGYDLILSSSHAVAKGILTNPDQLHICYCHSPVRYAWDLYHTYIKEGGYSKGLIGFFVKRTLHYLRIWDQSGNNRVNYFIANSNYVKKRIRNIYQRDAAVIYPPVDTGSFTCEEKKEDYYFTAARMVSYKRLDLLAEAFSLMPDKRLVIAGKGEELNKIKKKSGKNITILNHLNQNNFIEHIRKAKAFVYAAEEDFGIVMAEAQAAGTPVIAFRKGGASEIVSDGESGILFAEQTTDSIISAIKKSESYSFDPTTISKRASGFSITRFREEYYNYVENCCAEFFNLHE